MTKETPSQTLAEKISQLALEKKGHDISILDLRGISDISDFFVIISGESDTHVKTLATNIEKSLRDENIKAYHKEGLTRLSWVLLDYVDVVAHIFRKETRDYYALERLWADAKVKKVEDDAGTRELSRQTD